MSNQIFHFSWQNPILRESIYPFRNQKLRDFLLVYREIDLWKERDQQTSDGELGDELQALADDLIKEHRRIELRLEEAIADKMASDKWFAVVKSPNPDNLRFKRLYYLDRQIRGLTEERAQLLDRQVSLRKRKAWYEEGDTRIQMWEERALELDEPISQVTAELEDVKHLRGLFDLSEQLPRLEEDGSVSQDAAVQWKLHKYRQELEALNHDQLLRRVLEFFDKEPERFEPWFRYMIIHFSGMRYRSSHASWANPRYLLELLNREFMKAEIDAMDLDQVKAACDEAIAELEEEIANNENPDKIEAMERQITILKIWFPTRALLEYRMAKLIGELQNMPDDEEIYLERLKKLRQKYAEADDPIPDWVWSEIEKYTSLRLQTQKENWEELSPERWKWENRRWTGILNTWEKKDITSWRKRHEETLDLIVTRAVCNEIAEHIQHLRGISPAAGLASKPTWYLTLSRNGNSGNGDGESAYFKRAKSGDDFKNGASILWLDWVDKRPNAWQVARPVGNFNLLPPGVRLNGEKVKDTLEWSYNMINNSYVRIRRKPTIKQLKKQGVSKEEIEAIRQEMKEKGGFVKQFLRWTHEAIVVGVEDLIKGKYVLTFETGQIGLNLRRLGDLRGNRNVFIGYVPESDREPDALAEKLDRDLIMPGG